MGEGNFRTSITSEVRSLPLRPTMDPGFVHKRKIQTILGSPGMELIDGMISRLPPLPDWQKAVRIDHIYKDVFLDFCSIHGIKSLEENLAQEKGHMFASVEELAPCRRVFSKDERVVSKWKPRRRGPYKVEFRYSRKLIAADTLRSRLHQGATISLVAEFVSREGQTLVFEPILMGFPWVRSDDPKWRDHCTWLGYDFFEVFVEDFDEFAAVRQLAKPVEIEPMRRISEKAFKAALADLLGDRAGKDWGGETSDHVTSNLHLSGRRVTGAFLLKGPSKFKPMGLNHLGKNNDQIYRLAQEPVDVLILQHCHEILPAVRATLRAFAVQPSRARRYCLIDGRDSLWLLQAYGLLDKITRAS